jgi:hypothetical protein
MKIDTIVVRNTIRVEEPVQLLGDFDEDGVVNFSDFLIFASQFGKILLK